MAPSDQVRDQVPRDDRRRQDDGGDDGDGEGGTAPTVARGATELDELVAAAADEGFGGEVAVPDEPATVPIDTLVCGTCATSAPAGAFERAWSRRLEGASDPADMMHVSALTCPHCGSGGLYIRPFGAAASERQAAVLPALAPPAEPN
jgi:hypothetical protein